MMRVQDLKCGDWVQFMGLNRQSQYGKVKEKCPKMGVSLRVQTYKHKDIYERVKALIKG